MTIYQFEATTYTPPSITGLNFDFSGGALSLTQYVVPGGELFFSFGAVTLQYNQALHPEGFANFVSYANGLLYNKNQRVTTFPFTGQPITPLAPKVYNKLQFARPNGKGTGFIAGNVWVSNYYRWMYAEPGLEHDEYGYHNVQLGRRYLTNVYIETTITDFGTPFVAWENRDITPAGFEPTYFGNADVSDKAHYLRPVGRASTLQYGIPLVRDRAQTCYPFAYEATLTGHPVVDLWTKEIKPASMTQWPMEGDRFGPYRSVLNRNRYMKANGFTHSVLPQGGFVLNKARPIRPYGEVQTRFGTAFAAYRIRHVLPEWYEATPFGYDTWVRTRKIINLDGWGFKGPNVPLPTRVWSNFQTIRPYSTYPMTEMKKPWVSQGLRSLSPSSILTQPAGDPFVAYGVRYIRPLGIEKGNVGTHQLETHQNIIKLWGYTQGATGTPTIYNKTPMILAYSAYAFEPGIKPTVQLLRRTMYAYGIPPKGVGDLFVSYRTRKIRPPSPDYLRWGNGAVMFDQSQQTPPQKLILPPSVQAGAGSIPFEEWEHPDAPWSGELIPMPSPRVSLHTIFPPSLGQVDQFGTLTTRSMVIVCDPGPSSTTVGNPLLTGGTKWIGRIGIVDSGSVFGYPNVVGPQIIRLDAKWDTASSTWYPWSFHTSADPQDNWFTQRPQTAGPTFGAYSIVTLKHRRIYQQSSPPYDSMTKTLYGSPRISTRPQRIRPLGFNTYKRGMPDVSYKGDKPIYVMDWSDSVFGSPSLSVEDWGPKWVYPGGVIQQVFGNTRVELKNRRVYPASFNSFSSAQGAQYIGPYLRVYPHGEDSAAFGTLYIDYKHRRIYPADVTDDREEWRGAHVQHQGRGYFIPGTSMGSMGRPNVSSGSRALQPAGWEEFETGFSFVPAYYPGLSKMKAQNFIANGSILFTEIGNANVTHS